MSPSGLALVGYVAWNLFLSLWVLSFRAGLVLTRKRAPNGFDPRGDDVSPFSGRLSRAHANCYENLPMFGALILLALATGNAAITDPLARWALVARVAQSGVHLMSVSPVAVTIRSGFWVIQLAIMSYWVVRLGWLGFQ